VLAPPPVKVTEPPSHIVDDVLFAVTVGAVVLDVIVRLASSVQPLLAVTVTL